MNVKRIRNVRRRSAPGFWDFTLDHGRITEMDGPTDSVAPPPAVHDGELDVAGALVTPALVDTHVHLDLAYSLDHSPPNRTGTLEEALRLCEQVKADMTCDDVRDRAERAIRAEVRQGTGIFRTHADVSSAAGMRLLEGVLAAREATRDICKVLVVALPQDGLVRDPGAVDQVRRAMKAGADLVGGVPQVERTRRDGQRHLELLFELAEEFDANIDAHVDETTDPHSEFVEDLAGLTIERGWQGRVTASHLCALSSYNDDRAARIIDLLVEAEISVVSNPGTNLYMRGHADHYPKSRGLTRVIDLVDAGVICGVGQDHIQDPFYPFGAGRMLDAVYLLVHAEQMSSATRMLQAMEMACCNAGRVVGLGHHRPEVGANANLAFWPAGDLAELIRERPVPVAVLHAGRLVAGRLAGG